MLWAVVFGVGAVTVPVSHTPVRWQKNLNIIRLCHRAVGTFSGTKECNILAKPGRASSTLRQACIWMQGKRDANWISNPPLGCVYYPVCLRMLLCSSGYESTEPRLEFDHASWYINPIIMYGGYLRGVGVFCLFISKHFWTRFASGAIVWSVPLAFLRIFFSNYT